MIPVCKEIRKDILRISKLSGHGHVPTCFSVVEVLYAVYSTIKHDPKNPKWEERDLFILSKAHAALGHYCVLAKFGYFDIKKVESFGSFMSDFGCHADRFKIPGIEVSTGSLGHGIGVAVGMAFALMLKKSDSRVFVLIGDGEANEGSVWEAIMVAANLKLNNLIIIYDDNRSHARGLQISNPAEKLKAFGCKVVELDGHDAEALKSEIDKKDFCLKAIIANTKKGSGCKTMEESHYEWHRRSPNEIEYEKLMRELDAQTI